MAAHAHAPQLSTALLKAVSRSFYLSLRFLPQEVRPVLGLGYLIARASDTIADAASAPLQQRLELLDALARAVDDAAFENATPSAALCAQLRALPCPHPGEAALLGCAEDWLGCLASQPEAVRRELQRVLSTIFGGQRGDLVRFGYASEHSPQALSNATETEHYTYSVAGCVGEFWTRACFLQLDAFARAPLPELESQGRLFGQGLQLVNILRDLPADLRSGRCYLPADEIAAAGLVPSQILSHPREFRPVFDRWLGRAGEWLESGARYLRGIEGVRVRFSTSLPRLLGVETLLLLRRTYPLEHAERIRISRGTVLRSAASAVFESLA